MRKHIRRATLIFWACLLLLMLLLLMMGSLLTWSAVHYDKQLSAYLSQKLNSEVKLDLSDVSWDGIEPVLTFKTIQIQQKSAELTGTINGLSVKINPLYSLLLWRVVTSSVEINQLEINTNLDVNGQKESSNIKIADEAENKALFSWQDLQSTIQKALGQTLSYVDDIKPDINVKSFKLNVFGKNHRQITLMGSLSIGEQNAKGYYLKGQLETALKKSHIDFNFKIGQQAKKAYLEGSFYLTTKDLQKAVWFLGFNMLTIEGEKLAIGGYIKLKPKGVSQLALRLNGDHLTIINHKRKSKLLIDLMTMDLSGSYDSNGAFTLKLLPDQLTLNGQSQLLKQMTISYKPLDEYPWYMRIDEGQLKLLSLLRNVIPESMILESMRPYVESGTLTGMVHSLEIKRRVLFDLKAPFVIDSDFSNINYRNDKLEMDLIGINGHIRLTNTGGTAKLKAKALSLADSLMGMKKLPKVSLELASNWQVNNQMLDLSIQSLLLQNAWLQIQADGKLNWDFDKQLPYLDINAKAKALNVTKAQVQGVIPKVHVVPDLYHWLYTNLGGAEAVNAKLKLKGNLADFPFVNKKGIFDLSANIKGGKITPWEGWPEIVNADGKLIFDQGMFKVIATSGQTNGIKLLPSELLIKDVRPHITTDMSLNLHLLSDDNQAINYVTHSPLLAQAQTWLKWINYQGLIQSDVSILVPLGNHLPMTVSGKLNFVDGKLKLLPLEMDAYHTSGMINFDDQGVTDLIFNGWLGLNAPFRVKYSEVKKGYFNANANLTLSDKIDLADIITSKIKGQTGLDFTAQWTKSGGLFKGTSDLQGLSLSLAEPLVKTNRSAKLPFFIEGHWKNNKDLLTQLSLESRFGKKLYLKSDLNWKNPKLNLIANLDRFDLRDWVDLLINYPSKEKNLKYDKFTSLTYWLKADHALQNASQVNNFDSLLQSVYYGNGPKLEENALTLLLKMYYPNIQIKVGKLTGYGQVFKDLQLNSKYNKNKWQIDLSSKPSISQAKISLTTPFNGHHWQAEISYLELSKFEKVALWQSNGALFEGMPWWFPSLTLSIDDLSYQSSHLLSQSYINIVRKNDQITVPSYLLKGNNIFFLGSGGWDWNSNQINLQGNATSVNWGALLTSLGLEDILIGGEGPIVFDLSWLGGLKPDIKTLNGYFMFGLNRGSFPKLKPGLAKLLGVFSLEALLDRIGSGVNDLGVEGLYFNQIYGKYLIKEGIATATQNVMVDTPSFDMQVKGEVNFVNKTLNQDIMVQPHFSGTMALAAGIVGGPIAGLATYVVDKLAGASIFRNQGIAKIKVTGSFDNPKINAK